MKELYAGFRLAYSEFIREGYTSFSSADDCPYPKGTSERTAWFYGWDWADRRACGPAWMPDRQVGRPRTEPVWLGEPDSMSHDYDIRGKDIETRLVGEITETVIDAARLADREHKNGFPNFPMYRLILAGDRNYLSGVRQWWVLFSIEWCKQRMRSGYSEELATVAAWDTLQRAMEPKRPVLVADEVAVDLGVARDTYLYARKNLSAILGAALKTYWEWMEISYRVARKMGQRDY